MVASALVARPAGAQLRWDVGAEAGIAKRFTTGAPAGAPSPGVGPIFGLQGHVALVPMVRIGLYAEQDTEPLSQLGPRSFWAGGLHARVTPPLLGGGWRTWLYAGLGYGYVDWSSQRASGGIFDAPVGLGLGDKLGSWLVFAELGARFGFGFYGSAYSGQGGVPAVGQESVALCASVGLSLEQ